MTNKKCTNNPYADQPMLLRSVKNGGFLRTNAAFRSVAGLEETELAAESFLNWIKNSDLENARATIDGAKGACIVEHRTADGGWIPLEIRVVEHDGDPMVLALQPQEADFIEQYGDEHDEATVKGTLHTIAKIVEDQNPGYRCSILLVAEGRFVRGAGPSLPEYYNEAIDGFAIGPAVGSCGTAIYWNVPVIVEDIQADPLWVPFAELAQRAGVAACWSHPFTSRSGNVLGALALYSPKPQAPNAEQLSRLKAAARLTGLAVERGRAEEAIRANRKRELELEAQLRQAVKMEALGALAGGIAHDFNNVLASILANAELSREILPEDSEVQEMLNDIVSASKRAGQFCLQMLAYAGRGSLVREQIEIGALLAELNTLVQAAVSKKTTIEYVLWKQPVHVIGDENQLLQVIMNLVTNAAEAIGDRGGHITVSYEQVQYSENELRKLDPKADLAPGEFLLLRIKDNGPGMDAQTMTRIFDPFFTTKSHGHGLGLSAVLGIVKQHGGVIWIDSGDHSGTTFTVVLPTVKAVPIPVIATADSAPDVGHKCVLIADDEPAVRSILSRWLRRSGFTVLEAADGQEAVDLFAEHHRTIDCAVLDLTMPKLNGEEVQQAIHAIRKGFPIVVMSGFSEQETVNRFRDAGIASVLQKPISGATLIDSIRNAIAKPSRSA